MCLNFLGLADPGGTALTGLPVPRHEHNSLITHFSKANQSIQKPTSYFRCGAFTRPPVLITQVRYFNQGSPTPRALK